MCGQNKQKGVGLQLRLKGPGQEKMRGVRGASVCHTRTHSFIASSTVDKW